MKTRWQTVTWLVTWCLVTGHAWSRPPVETDRATLVREAEAEARKLFAQDHYVFVTPRGRVDPAEGGIPTFALREHRWAVYRGHKRISEYRLLRAVGRPEDARRARRRRVLLVGAAVLGAGVAGISATQVDFQSGDTTRNAVGTLGFAGGFAGSTVAQVQLSHQLLAIEDLFFDVQKLNDRIWDGIRAQVRMQYGVPLLSTPPSPR